MRQLAAVADLTARRKWSEALAQLTALDKRFPNRPEVITELANVAYELKDTVSYQQYCEQLVKLLPGDAHIRQSLARSYLANRFPFLALRTFRGLLQDFPNPPQAEEMQRTIALLESELQMAAAQSKLEEDVAADVLVLNDQMRSHLLFGKLKAAEATARKQLVLQPDFVPALNNLSQLEFNRGNKFRGIELVERVLELEPQNFQALGNLARYLWLTGNPDQATEAAERLLSAQSDNAEIWGKKMEAMTYLGRDEDVLAIAAEAERAGYFAGQNVNPLIYHFRAAAAARTGDKELARRSWRQALAINPQLDMARQNLADLDRPAEEQEGAWALTPESWLSQAAIAELKKLPLNSGKGQRSVERAIRGYFQKYPEIEFLISHMLERGDPITRGMAAGLALYSDAPDLHQHLRAFITGPHGPDNLRMEFGRLAMDQGIMQPGQMSMWIRGQQTELVQVAATIDYEPRIELPPAAQELSVGAYRALEEGDLDQAEKLLLQAMDIPPASPHVLNNLALVYERQQRPKEAQEVMQRVQSEFPDYFFGIIFRANLAIYEDQLELATTLLAGLLSRSRYHISEFRALCMSHIQLFLARDMPETAESWLNIWAETEPDYPNLVIWRLRVGRARKPMRRRRAPRLFKKP